jgi:hypothetical protein
LRGYHHAAFGGIDCDWEKSEPFNLNQGGGTVRDFEHTLNNFAGTAARFIRKLWHS